MILVIYFFSILFFIIIKIWCQLKRSLSTGMLILLYKSMLNTAITWIILVLYFVWQSAWQHQHVNNLKGRLPNKHKFILKYHDPHDYETLPVLTKLRKESKMLQESTCLQIQSYRLLSFDPINTITRHWLPYQKSREVHAQHILSSSASIFVHRFLCELSPPGCDHFSKSY